jgi:hypothetical protein
MENKMILQNKTLIVVAGFVVSTALSAGSTSGSGPPSRQALEEMLLSAPAGFQNAGLFTDESGIVGLGVNTELVSSLKITRNLDLQSLAVSADNFNYLDGLKNRNIEAVRLKKPSLIPTDAESIEHRSYKIEDGEQLGELLLIDRRNAARAAINK